MRDNGVVNEIDKEKTIINDLIKSVELQQLLEQRRILEQKQLDQRLILKKNKTIILILILSLICLMLFAFFKFTSNTLEFFDFAITEFSSTFGFLITLFVIAVSSITYLETNQNDSKSSYSRQSRQIIKLKQEIDLLKDKISGISNISREDLSNEIMERLKDESINIYLESVKGKLIENEYKYSIHRFTNKTLLRIENQIRESNKRGNWNLTIGILFAVTGGFVLYTFISNDSFLTYDIKNIETFLISFLPRISIIILIEVFSYFFLRLYKLSIDDVKYFQNEMTNLETKFLALEVAIHSNDKDRIDLCITDLLSVERNPIFDNNKITKEVLLNNSNPDQLLFSVDQFTKLFEILNKKETK